MALNIEDQAKHIVSLVHQMEIPDDLVPDLVADLAAAERRLKELRLSLIEEAPGPVEGEVWRLVETRSAARSYNPSALLRDFTPEGGSFADTIIELVEAGVIRLGWQWSALRKEADRRNIALTVAPREISDGADAHVGEVWSTKLEPKPKT